MKIRTLNKRRKRLNKYKMFLLAHMYSAIKTIKSKDYLITDYIEEFLRRIYFYRKSAIEIFTPNKSYYFNFYENPLMENYKDDMAESNLVNIISLLN